MFTGSLKCELWRGNELGKGAGELVRESWSLQI